MADHELRLAQEAREIEGAIRFLVKGHHRIVSDLRALGIHVGLGQPAECVTCRVPWPCPASDEPQNIRPAEEGSK